MMKALEDYVKYFDEKWMWFSKLSGFIMFVA
jgi:hypothetical protein